MIKKMTLLGTLMLFAACEMDTAEQTTNNGAAIPSDQAFEIRSAAIAPLMTRNLCTAIGGKSVQPALTVLHSPISGQRVTVRMYDVHNDGTVSEHRTVRVRSEADGSTLVNKGFLPPCNTTEGRRNSSYRFDISAANDTITLNWGDFNSKTMQIQ